uniref:thymidine kinase n=1 Tax=viral metagenome TaxID=1070528 RepID=A0A6C0JXU6_9ZZZZ
MEPEIEVYTGPMFSGKTSSICSALNTLSQFSEKCVLVRPSIDSRVYLSHSNIIRASEEDFGFETVSVDKLGDLDVSGYDFIAVDEGQFFEDLKTVVDWRSQGKKVFVACLSSDFRREIFPRVADIIPHVTLHQLKAVCIHCRDEGRHDFITATYTKRIFGDDNQIAIGGAESYEARCPVHF